ncbi:MAG: ABC transporter permease [Planctomycetaceae bacterium]
MGQASAHDGQSQWQLIWREFRKRPLAVASAVVVFLLILASVWAPFLANDRPLMYFGVNRAEYRESLRTCNGAIGRLIEGRQKEPDKPPLKTLVQALKLHVGLMAAAVSPDDSQRLNTWFGMLQAALADADATAGAQKLAELKKTLSGDLSERSVTFQAKTRWPVFASLNWLDVGFLVWSLTTVSAPAWRLLLRFVRVKSRRISAAWLVWLGVPLLAAGLWWWRVPAREDQTQYKQGVLAEHAEQAIGRVPVVYEGVVWPPIPYGLAESVLEKKYLRPAWLEEKPSNGKTEEAAAPPSSALRRTRTSWDRPHWLGTDSLGRDVLSRMIWGGRVSLSVGVVSVSIYVVLGVLIGAVAGFFRGFVDLIISRIIEVVICFPTFFLILTIVALRGPNIMNIMVVIGLTGWTGVARLVRAEFLRLVDQEFVLAGRALGYTPVRLIFRHVLPNAMAPVLVAATFGIAGAILTESALSFLGLGITIPIPSWGGILLDGRRSEGAAPWLVFLPGLAIFVTITCYNLVGEALRDASDPRLRGSR